MRKKYDKAFKSKVAIEALRGEKTLQELSVAYQVHPNMIAQWKKTKSLLSFSGFLGIANQIINKEVQLDLLH